MLETVLRTPDERYRPTPAAAPGAYTSHGEAKYVDQLSPAGLYQGELDSVAQPVEDDRDQTLDRRLRGHCTCSFKGVEAKRRQFVRRYITSDGTDVLGLGEQTTDDVDQPLLGSGDVLGLVDERAEFRPMLVPFEGDQRIGPQH